MNRCRVRGSIVLISKSTGCVLMCLLVRFVVFSTHTSIRALIFHTVPHRNCSEESWLGSEVLKHSTRTPNKGTTRSKLAILVSPIVWCDGSNEAVCANALLRQNHKFHSNAIVRSSKLRDFG